MTDGSGTNFHMDPSIDLVYDASRGVVSDGTGAGPLDLARGARRAEDIVLSNVYAFDVKVYDGILNEFVDLGHLKSNGVGAEGEFHRNKLILGADGAPGEAGTDDDGINGADDAGEIGWPGTDDFGNRFGEKSVEFCHGLRSAATAIPGSLEVVSAYKPKGM